jgi:filamentous hemagglutinin family protein
MMERISKTFKRQYFRKVIIYFLTWCLIVNTSLPAVLAGPTGGEFTEGTGSITQVGNATNVVVDQVQSVIEWTSLDTVGGEPGVRESLNFSQGGLTNSAVLNRVLSGYGTQFYGDLNAEGMRIFIVNPAGVIFGEGSTINVTQLVASNLDISDSAFSNGEVTGEYEFAGDIEGVDVHERLGVINSGTITTTPGAEGVAEGVALIGQKILNTGTITTGEGGFVVMAAGDRVLLGEPGSNIIVEMDSVTLTDPENPEGFGNVVNESIDETEPGIIDSPEGTVVLAAGDVFASALELPKVSGGIGRIEQKGHIHANGNSSDGGNVSLTAADEVILASGSQTTANAGTDSDAGLVVVHSLGRTIVEADAQIQATGGHVPEDILGDFDDVVKTAVEISGDYVNLAGNVDASAITEGKRGKIVIDALDITVKDGSIPDNPEDNTIYEEWIEEQTRLFDDYDQYVSTDVELVAHSKEAGNITVEYMDDGFLGIDGSSGNGGSGDIVLRTKYDTGAITFLEDGSGNRTTIQSTAGGNVYMMAGGDDPDTEEITEGSIIVGDIISTVPQSIPVGWPVEPGKIRLLTVNDGSITTGQLTVEGGSYDEISVIASGDLTINGDVTTYAHQVDEGLAVGQARTCLVSEHGDVEINGAVSVHAHAVNTTTAEIHIDAGQDIRIDLNGGQINATAFTSGSGTADASVKIHAGTDTDPEDLTKRGEITIINPKSADKAIEILAQAGGKKSEIFSDGQTSEYTDVTNDGTHAELEIDDKRIDECPECPAPPGLVPPLDPWAFTTHMNVTLKGYLLEDQPGLEIVPGSWDTDTPHGTLTIEDDGSYIYTPDAGFVGQDRFTYKAKVTDTGVETDLVEVTITVTNNSPIQHDDTVTINQGQTVIIDVLANDSDPDHPEYEDELTVVQDSITVEHGKLILNDDNTFTYIPDPSFTGKDIFTYAVRDGESGQELIWTTVVIWVNAVIFMPAPIPEPIAIEVSGCPALINWVAAELGTDKKNVQIWMANALASARDIQPCDACANLMSAATILKDVDGTRVAALAQVINEFASSTAPPTEEQMASIADAIANDIEGNSQYAAAGEYLDALAKYVGVLTSEMGFSADESIQFATDNYASQLAEGENVGVAAYIAAKLAALGGS